MDHNNFHGIIIKVENMEVCRAFYRDVLDLGTPVIDSNFWVEFKLNESMALILEKIDTDEKLSVKKGRISWIHRTDDLDKLLDRLKQKGFAPLDEEKERIGFKVVKFCDPEGNPFFLSCAKNDG